MLKIKEFGAVELCILPDACDKMRKVVSWANPGEPK
jgi:hypothetical protein